MANRPTKPQEDQKIGNVLADPSLARLWWGRVGERPDWSGRITAWLTLEIAGRRLFLWVPIGLMIGILLYTAADQEPNELSGPLLVLVLGGLAWLQRHHFGPAFFILTGLTCIASGFTIGSVQTRLTSRPVLENPYFGYVTGWIEEIDWRADSARMIVRVESLYTSKTTPADQRPQRPFRIRVTVTGRPDVKTGDRIRAATRLQPPPGPAVPGGYDFRFDSFFKQIGGVGSLSGALTVLRPLPPDRVRDFWTGLDQFRNRVTQRITSVIGGQEGAVAAALVTGKRGTIDENTNDILRAAGIYHVISISGLHMVIAAGFAFTTARLMLLLIPGLVLRTDIRRWSALAGIVGSILYDLFAGSDIATERSMLMSIVFFGAILAGRRLLSMRNWALAAIVLLVVEPQGVLNPGFQMSFAAVAALIALYEKRPNIAGFEVNHSNETAQSGTRTPIDRIGGNGSRPERPAVRWIRSGIKVSVDIVLTTLIAELATAPFGLFHFHMLQTYGIVGNAITLPFVSFIVMPSAFLGMLLLPFGWDGPIWQIMGFGVHGVLEASRLIASWPNATLIMPGFGTVPLLWLTAGLAFLTLWISPLRWIGCLGLGVGGVMMGVNAHHYDIMIGREARFMAVRGPDGQMAFAGRGINRFSLLHDLREVGDTRPPNAPDLVKKSACDSLSCTLPMQDGRLVVLMLAQTAKSKTKADHSADWFKKTCASASVLIIPEESMLKQQAEDKTGRKPSLNSSASPIDNQTDLIRTCKAQLITPDLIARQGPLALTRANDGRLMLTTNNSESFDRPWARKAAGISRTPGPTIKINDDDPAKQETGLNNRNR